MSQQASTLHSLIQPVDDILDTSMWNTQKYVDLLNLLTEQSFFMLLLLLIICIYSLCCLNSALELEDSLLDYICARKRKTLINFKHDCFSKKF